MEHARHPVFGLVTIVAQSSFPDPLRAKVSDTMAYSSSLWLSGNEGAGIEPTVVQCISHQSAFSLKCKLYSGAVFLLFHAGELILLHAITKHAICVFAKKDYIIYVGLFHLSAETTINRIRNLWHEIDRVHKNDSQIICISSHIVMILIIVYSLV